MGGWCSERGRMGQQGERDGCCRKERIRRRGKQADHRTMGLGGHWESEEITLIHYPNPLPHWEREEMTLIMMRRERRENWEREEREERELGERGERGERTGREKR